MRSQGPSALLVVPIHTEEIDQIRSAHECSVRPPRLIVCRQSETNQKRFDRAAQVRSIFLTELLNLLTTSKPNGIKQDITFPVVDTHTQMHACAARPPSPALAQQKGKIFPSTHEHTRSASCSQTLLCHKSITICARNRTKCNRLPAHTHPYRYFLELRHVTDQPHLAHFRQWSHQNGIPHKQPKHTLRDLCLFAISDMRDVCTRKKQTHLCSISYDVSQTNVYQCAYDIPQTKMC